MTEGFAAAAPAVAHVFVERVGDEDGVWVDGDDGHHLQRVRRLRVGEAVTASDGLGTWQLGSIAEVGERRLRISPIGPVTREPALTPRWSSLLPRRRATRPVPSCTSSSSWGWTR